MASSEASTAAVTVDGKQKSNKPKTPRGTPSPEAHIIPTSPPYPPYGYIDPAQLAANGYEVSSDPVNFTTYVYPLSPQFSVQYYPDYATGYQSYPGSPALHPQSPPMNPTSPPFSPTFSYQQGITLSPPTHAYVLPHTQPFPPLHISSPVLTGTSIPGSPPHQYHLPGPYIIQTDNRVNKRSQQHNYHQQQIHQQQQQQLQHHLEQELNSYHTHNIYVRGLASSTTDASFLEMCQV
jgi:hypothetical protein